MIDYPIMLRLNSGHDNLCTLFCLYAESLLSLQSILDCWLNSDSDFIIPARFAHKTRQLHAWFRIHNNNRADVYWVNYTYNVVGSLLQTWTFKCRRRQLNPAQSPTEGAQHGVWRYNSKTHFPSNAWKNNAIVIETNKPKTKIDQWEETITRGS